MFAALAVVLPLTLGAQTPPDPQPDPFTPNLFYGAVPAGGDQAPVLVFVHGLGGNAYFWWTGHNDMYAMAYTAGYRTAFMSLSADNSRNSSAFPGNGLVLRQLFPKIAAHFSATQFYVVAHSEGGLDTEFAILDPSTAGLVKTVFCLAVPNQGTPLADWAFGPGKPEAGALGLLTPAVYTMQVAVVSKFRTQADPTLAASGIPFFTLAGNQYKDNFLLKITGHILANLTNGEDSDGLVPVSDTLLPSTYSTDLGVIGYNHYKMGTGTASFALINAQILAMDAVRRN